MFRGLVLCALMALALTLGAAAPVLAADPTPPASPGASPVFVDPLDPRGGESASKVGAPFLALVFVVGLGGLTAVATVVFVRLSRRA